MRTSSQPYETAVASPTPSAIARELPRRDPVVHDAVADAEALGDGGHRETVIGRMLK